MTPAEFAQKWRGVTTTEKASAQSHFLDLCALLGQPGPIEADPTGTDYAFEKRVSKAAGGDGFADVWKRDCFGWEYKGKRKDLKAAYSQLLNYKDDLGNPPLLVVCDLARFEIHPQFAGLAAPPTVITLDDLAADDPSDALAGLHNIFDDPDAFRPHLAPEQITEHAARRFAEIAQALRARGHEAGAVAHFLDRILFCLFAEDARLLPAKLFERLADASKGRSSLFTSGLADLFAKMSRDGGLFGAEVIEWFNGGLFDGADVLPLTGSEITTLLELARLDWARIEVAIFGTLFERGLDPGQRAQLGAHYTDRAAIEALVDPVILRPLRREFEAMQARVTEFALAGGKLTARARAEFGAFLERLRAVRVLDPACGSGNFLVVAMEKLKDLEWEAINWGSHALQLSMQMPQIGPEVVLGIELNAYAAELARVTVWIGYLQWTLRKGIPLGQRPILKSLDHIECRDALLDLSDPPNLREAEWPGAEFVVGNPPFLGGKLLRRGLGDGYVGALFAVFDGRVPREADLVTYWHEKARAEIAAGRLHRAGLLATQGIRGGANRRVLEHILQTGGIFFARSDDPWVLAGANVRISFVGQDDGTQTARELDGRSTAWINAGLASERGLSEPRRLSANLGVAFMGDTKGGQFDISETEAREFLRQPNPHGRPNSDVVRPRVNGLAARGGASQTWVIDFGVDMPEREASLYEAPFEYIKQHVLPVRQHNARKAYADRWWLHVEPRPAMRAALAPLNRFIVTVIHSKHRVFWWVSPPTLPDHSLVVIARDDDFTFGILQSRVHGTWASAMGTHLEDRPRYTVADCFETFPFPDPTPEQRERVGEAARRLVELRDGWLNPLGLDPADLAKRTLTNLYNARPTWLANAHADLDTAVLAAYAWPANLPDTAILERLLALNLARAGLGALQLADTE